MTAQFSSIVAKMRRSARNGERLHLDHAEVLALIGSPIYPMLADLESLELTEQWQKECSLESFGSHQEPTATSGQSVGTTDELAPAAENQLALATAEKIIRLSRRSRNSPNTSRNTESQSKPKQTLRSV